MKKTFLFGMIALLSVSFVFMGCPDGGEDEPEKSDAKAITTVLGVAPVAVTGDTSKDGTTEAKAKPYTVTLPSTETATAVKLANIVVSANAAALLYSDDTFATAADDTNGINLAAAGTALDVYVKVTAQDNSVAFYKVSITKQQQAASDAKAITTVLSVAPVAVTGDTTKDGTEAAKAKPYTVTLPSDSIATAVKLTDIVVSANATPVLYSEATFATEADGTNGINLAAAGTALDVYIKVTAQDNSVAFYKVSITKQQ
jgi:hypothetical protein